MNKEQRDFLEELDSLKAEMKNFLDANDIENAKAKKLELEALKEKISLYENLNEEIKIQNFTEVEIMDNKNVVTEFKNALMGKDYDNALVQRGVDADGGYLVPQEELNVIEQFKRQQIALKDRCRVIPTQSGKGQMPVEVEANMLLANLTEGEEIPQSQINFGVIAWNVKDYGDIIPVSRQVLQDENCGLMAFIGQRFAKKAVYTENAKILEVLEANENVVTDADIMKGLNKALNVELDPANAMNAVIICNQTKFDALDNMVDGNDRPMLQPMPADPTRKMYKGHEVVVMADKELDLDGYIVADMANAVLFADRMGVEVAISEEAGFTRNVVYARVIERFDVQAIDGKAVCIVKQA